jgi:hypothetical protein
MSWNKVDLRYRSLAVAAQYRHSASPSLFRGGWSIQLSFSLQPVVDLEPGLAAPLKVKLVRAKADLVFRPCDLLLSPPVLRPLRNNGCVCCHK